MQYTVFKTFSFGQCTVECCRIEDSDILLYIVEYYGEFYSFNFDDHFFRKKNMEELDFNMDNAKDYLRKLCKVKGLIA